MPPCTGVEREQGTADARGMRVPIVILVILILATPMRAQKSASDSVVRAFELWRGGQPRKAIAILDPLLRAGAQFEDASDPGVGWTILGHSYLDLDKYAEARQAYEHAMEILRPIPSVRGQYASTLDSMGMLEASLGQRDVAKALCAKARGIYVALGNPAGVSIASTNLAVIALGRNDFKDARRSLQEALEEAKRARAMRDEDFAAMDAARSALALHDRKGEEAVSAAQAAIDLWTRAHGPGYFMLANGYLLRAQALAHSGDYGSAIRDGQHALAIAESALGRDTIGFLTTEAVYARILRASGAKEEASHMTKEASRGLADLDRRQCSGCTIDASGFR
jgi:tetratricopeptide (TPR) repeat protein